MLGATSQTINLVGYALGGMVIAWVDTTTAIFINAISFFISAIVLVFISIPALHSTSAKGFRGFYRDSLAGIQFIWSKKVLRICIFFGAVINLFGAPLHIFTAVFSKSVLFAGTAGYGYLEAAFTAGGIVGALISGKYSSHLRLWQWFYLTFSLAGVALLIMTLLPNLIMAIILSFTVMTALSLLNVPLITSIILASPQEVRGRVLNSFGVLVSGLSVPIGLIGGGWIMDQIGPLYMYGFVGAALIIAGGASLFIREFRDESELEAGFQKHGVENSI